LPGNRWWVTQRLGLLNLPRRPLAADEQLEAIVGGTSLACVTKPRGQREGAAEEPRALRHAGALRPGSDTKPNRSRRARRS
jgi:hypothetical protein